MAQALEYASVASAVLCPQKCQRHCRKWRYRQHKWRRCIEAVGSMWCLERDITLRERQGACVEHARKKKEERTTPTP
eukprot:1073867-Rhodomonas_salina.1